MTNSGQLHRPGRVGEDSASGQDNNAIRESMAGEPIREQTSQAAGGTTNEMGGGKALPRR